ncbi:MAG: translation elongation factor Ts [Wenzhouxiangellaceae bacterium]|nr:translation elongation factor Ts [Wenzhouxiangellaceae bacterium]
MTISASLVKELRERSGAGMMECKKALVETGGDLEAAIEHLRKSGLAKADKKAGRVAAEGVIVHAGDPSSGVLVEVNCETDFVAKDDNFRAFAQRVAELALAAGDDDVARLAEAEFGDGESVETRRQQLVAKLGENIQIRRIRRLAADGGEGGGVLGGYIHGGRIGVLVALVGGDEEVARDLAMHVAALNPPYVDADSVPAEVLEKEKEILRAQAEDSGKPPEIVEKMIAGRLNKHLAEITLVGQPFVKDSDQTVGKLLESRGARVTGFVRLEVGEGIQKEEADFAAEVMQQARGG